MVSEILSSANFRNSCDVGLRREAEQLVGAAHAALHRGGRGQGLGRLEGRAQGMLREEPGRQMMKKKGSLPSFFSSS